MSNCSSEWSGRLTSQIRIAGISTIVENDDLLENFPTKLNIDYKWQEVRELCHLYTKFLFKFVADRCLGKSDRSDRTLPQ